MTLGTASPPASPSTRNPSASASKANNEFALFTFRNNGALVTRQLECLVDAAAPDGARPGGFGPDPGAPRKFAAEGVKQVSPRLHTASENSADAPRGADPGQAAGGTRSRRALSRSCNGEVRGKCVSRYSI